MYTTEMSFTIDYETRKCTLRCATCGKDIEVPFSQVTWPLKHDEIVAAMEKHDRAHQAGTWQDIHNLGAVRGDIPLPADKRIWSWATST